MNEINNQKQTLPWYKEYYVWLIIFFPLLAVLAGIATTIMAINSYDGLVVDDYYKQGLEINRTLERDQSAIDYGLNAFIELKPEKQEVILQLEANTSFNYPQSFTTTFLHSTRAGLDKEVKMTLVQDNRYQGQLTALERGKWYIHIQRDNWRLIKTLYID